MYSKNTFDGPSVHRKIDPMENKLIPDPFIRFNEHEVKWVEDADWDIKLHDWSVWFGDAHPSVYAENVARFVCEYEAFN